MIFRSSDSLEIHKTISKLKYLKFQKINEEFIAILTDDNNYEILKGYGRTKIDAINDLHHNLV